MEPVWVRMWMRRDEGREKRLPQSSQAYRPVWPDPDNEACCIGADAGAIQVEVTREEIEVEAIVGDKAGSEARSDDLKEVVVDSGRAVGGCALFEEAVEAESGR